MSGWIAPETWDACLHDEPIRDDGEIVIGFDPAAPDVVVLCQVTDEGLRIISL